MREARLGDFRVADLLARGGMGQVWRAHHIHTHTPAALKVLAPEVLRRPSHQEAFRAEVRAVAALDHPNVITVFDKGTVTEEAQARSGGELQAGCPYLVMALADGTARSHPPQTWAATRDLLAQLLDGLAHAHAHALIHRDLKPDNLLWIAHAEATARWKLSDWGLVRALSHDAQDEARREGTPAYMAPEQILATVGSLAPTTDLYAVGCTAWELLTGRPPFYGEIREVLSAHLHWPPPRFQPRFPVPREVEGWLRCLLEKSPERRFELAADAREALDALGNAGEGEDTVLAFGAQQTVPALPLTRRIETWFTTVAMGEDDLASPPAQTEPPAPLPLRASPPADWRPAPWTRPPLSVRVAGMALFGLRTVPLTGRRLEQDALWSALRDALREHRAVALLLHGHPGIGRSRLARWLGTRAAETGSAHPIVVQGAGDLLPAVWDRLPPRTRPPAPPWPLDGQEGGPPSDADLGLLIRVLHRAAAHRPLVLVLDDLHLIPGGDRLVGRLLQAPEPSPIFVLATAPDRHLDGLRLPPSVTSLPLHPLPPESQRSLLAELLGLEPQLATRIASRTHGNPGFMVQMVTNLVEQDALVPRGDGLGLREGLTLTLPTDLRQVWEARLHQVARGLPAQALIDLERAAVMGEEVERTIWDRLCDDGGAEAREAREALVQRLLRTRLAEGTGERWRLASPLCRQALVARAAEAGRVRAHHAACVKALERQVPRSARQQAQLGHHLLRAGRPAEALGPLLDGARQLAELGATQAALQHLEEAGRALDLLPAEGAALERVQLSRAKAGAYRRQLDHRAALHHAKEAVQSALAHQVEEELLAALSTLALTLGALTRFEEAEQVLAQLRELGAEEAFEYQDALWAVRASQHRHREALQAARRILALATRRPAVSRVWALRRIGTSANHCGELQEALDAFRRGVELCAEHGLQADLGHCLVGEGAVAMQLQQYEEAEQRFREAQHIFATLATHGVYVVHLNLARVRLLRGRPQEAERAAQQARDALERLRHPRLPLAVALQLWSAAARGDLATFDAHLTTLRDLPRDPEVTEALERAAEAVPCEDRATQLRAWVHAEA